MPKESLLDASALLALVLREPGWKVIDTIAESGLALTTSIALTEALEICRQKKTGISQDEVRMFAWRHDSPIPLRYSNE